jgi:hypothetical protein
MEDRPFHASDVHKQDACMRGEANRMHAR